MTLIISHQNHIFPLSSYKNCIVCTPLSVKMTIPFQVLYPSIILRQRLNSGGVGLCVFLRQGEQYSRYILLIRMAWCSVYYLSSVRDDKVIIGGEPQIWLADNKVLLISLSSLSRQKSHNFDIYSGKCHFKQWQMCSPFLSYIFFSHWKIKFMCLIQLMLANFFFLNGYKFLKC